MATFDEIQAQINALNSNIDKLSQDLAALRQTITGLEQQDPCQPGFKEQIDAAAAQAASATALANESIAQADALKPVVNSYTGPGKADLVRQGNTAVTSLNNLGKLTTSFNGKARRDTLYEKVAACPANQPEEEQDSKEDPAVDENEVDTDQQNREYANENGADDDSNNTQNNPSDSPDSNINAGTTQAGKSNTAKAKTAAKPDKRQKNPLGNLSSYTYNFTLYMVTPEAYDAFVASGRKDINAIRNVDVNAAPGTSAAIANSGAGTYVLAQSGGINNQTQVRAPGFDYDYYIDNVKIVTNTPGSSTQTATSTTEITFDIIEPYGFSFISNLTRARYAILKNSKLPNVQQSTNNFKQIFILGCRFYGYDKNGNPATTADFNAEDTINPAAQKGGGGDTSLFERFFDIAIVGIKFKLDGKSTVYNITSNALPEQTAMTTSNGRINKDISVQAATVYDALMADSGNQIGLLASLNKQYEQMVKDKDIEIANKYDVKFIGNELDVNALKTASMIIPSDLDKLKTGMAGKNITDDNAYLQASTFPQLNVKLITFKNDTAILQAIGLIIAQSRYLYNAMTKVFTAEEDEQTEKDGGKNPIKWYNLGADVKVLGFDNKRKEWAYSITYVIQPFETPYFNSPFPNGPKPYYGPHKRYEYWYTGQNSEILRYEQQINGNYFTVALGYTEKEVENQSKSVTGQPQLSLTPHVRTPMIRQGITGEGMEAQNSYLTSLYDPRSWASATVTIMGDPDYLMNTAPNTLSQVYDPYYQSDGFTINPNGGQVFIEIDFKEPQDYDARTGLLTINESIQFVDLPKRVKDVVKGVSYTLLKVTSTFRGGQFTQELKCNIAEWSGIMPDSPAVSDGSYERAENARFSRQGTGSATTPSQTQTSGNGLLPAPVVVNNPMGDGDGLQEPSNVGGATPPVAQPATSDDDALSPNGPYQLQP